jgi:hypothetical protein
MFEALGTALAGFVIREDKPWGFNDAWNADLPRQGAAWLNSADLVNFRREWRDWTPRRRALATLQHR